MQTHRSKTRNKPAVAAHPMQTHRSKTRNEPAVAAHPNLAVGEVGKLTLKMHVEWLILKATDAEGLSEIGKIQDLWSGYGTIRR